jgi:hypothetical protein
MLDCDWSSDVCSSDLVKPPPEKIEKVDTPPPATGPKLVKLVIESNPDGAEVFEKDISLGVTPLPLNREAQSILELKLVLKGYHDLNKKVAVPTEDGNRSFDLEKKRSGGGAAPVKTGGEIKDPYATPVEEIKDPYANP